jgi:hypothetical protein
MKKLVKALILISIGFLLPISMTKSYSSSTISNFPGPGHTFDFGCHSDSISFVAGTVNLTSSKGNNVNAGDQFIISVNITGFTDAAGQLITLGFSSQRSDNNKFGFNPGFVADLSINSSGNADVKNFTVTASSTGGTFTIVADALSGSIGGSDEAFNWTFGSIGITVQGPSNRNPDTPPDFTMFIIVISITIAGVSGLVVILVKLSKPKRFFD